MARHRPVYHQTRAAAKTPVRPTVRPEGRYARRMRYPGDVDAGPAAGGQERPAGRPWLPWPRPEDGGEAAARPADQYADSGYPAGSGHAGRGDDGAQHPGAIAAAASQALYGSAGGTARKGPVRGFPPAPGQAPPVYPPGQFSAWNQASGGPGPGGAAVKPATDAWPVAASAEHGYAEPDYAILAVSDPAADATATQTWAVADDRAAGSWQDPDGRDNAIKRGDAGSQAGRRTRGRPAGQPAAAAQDGATVAAPPGGGAAGRPGGMRPQRTIAASAGKNGQPPSPQAIVPAGDLPGRPARGSSRGTRGRKPAAAKRGRVLLAAALAVLVVAASGTYFFLTSGQGRTRQGAAPKTSQPAARPSPTPTATGRWGHIQTRRTDPRPVTLAELFPARFTSNGSAYSRTADRAGKHCAAAVLGSRLQSAVRAAGCSQVLRASYLSGNRKLMGTIGVLNLKTAHNASRAGQATGRSEFIAQLRGKKGPTRNLTKGTGIEEAEFKGHYLILIWAEFASLHAPKTTAKKNELEQFCTRLFGGTANVSLSARLVTGKP
jgi:hypothetical protein